MKKQSTSSGNVERKRGFFSFLNRHPILEASFYALILAFLMEVISRRSLIFALSFTVHSPHFFLAGWAVIFLTFSLAPFFPKRTFVYCLFGVLWLSMSITNAALVVIRTAPFEAVDFSIIRTGLGIITIYLKVWQIILISLAILAALAGVVLVLIKVKRQKVNFRRALIGVGLSALITFGMIVPLNLLGYYPYAFSNLTESYDRYGFTYCFTCSIFDRGVNRPDGYSEDGIRELTAMIDGETPEKADSTPNVIILQLESFFDVSRLADVDFSENPIPFFTELKKQYSTGLLTVPTIGAGTANTEFELVTGMSHNDFGTGEYPYKSFLQRESCESVAYLLGELGYKSHAIHNYSATFYARNVAYASLGFDTFTPMEYMNGLEYNQLGWAKDYVLTGEILDALRSTEERDLVLTISVQGHGKYVAAEDPRITATSGSIDPETLDSLIYYVNQLYEMDEFLRELTEALSYENFGEEVMIVMYGDHLPSMALTEEDFREGNMYQTDYVIWTNRPAERATRNVAAYQLSAYALSLAGISRGTILRLHQTELAAGTDDYHDELRLLEYDLVNGKKYAYGKKERYEIKDIAMGVNPITVSSVAPLGEKTFLVTGENFTDWSVVCLNGKKCATTYVSPTHLRVTGKELNPGDSVTVEQISVDRVRLGSTEGVVYRASDAPPPKTWAQKHGWIIPVAGIVLLGCLELSVVLVRRQKKKKR